MKLHYAGKYNNDKNTLPHRNHPVNFIPFKEPDASKFALIANIGALVLLLFLVIPFLIIAKENLLLYPFQLCIGSCLTLFPHEILHALCFKEDVYLYTNLDKGLLFVSRTEDMSKHRFIFMSLIPNTLFFVQPKWIGLGIFRCLCISMGFGDYFNVYNAITQVPSDGIIYLNGFHSFWYQKQK